jgi:hypothetical protein
MVARLHTNGDPWPRITQRVRGSKGKVVAAVAYLGQDAPQILPLKKGDLLVCDASRSAIAQGSTSLEAIEQYQRRGVKCYTHSGLHAKVVVLSKTVFIGSANASAHSMNALNEAVVELSEIDIIDQTREFVESLATQRGLLIPARLFELRNVKVRKRLDGPGVDRPPQHVPTQVRRLWIIETNSFHASEKYYSVLESSRKNVADEVKETFKGVALEDYQDKSEYLEGLRMDDWVINLVDNKRVSCPAIAISKFPITKLNSLVWLARPKSSVKSIGLKLYEELIGVKGLADDISQSRRKYGLLITDNATKKYLKPFMRD